MDEADYLTAIRTSYDTVAESYASLVPDRFSQDLLGQALLGAFAEYIVAAGGGQVADIGCGPGHVTAHLASLGLDVFGIDLSPKQIEVARRTCPGLRFEVGSMTALDLADGSLAGIVAWWSIVHTPPGELPVVIAEFERTLAPGAHTLLGFHAGTGERRQLEQAYGHPVNYISYRQSPDYVSELLAKAGLTVTAQLTQAGERCPQVCLLARKPG
ncbi:class I SAM-dependent DNA methyltransferase [Flindersiella endophytica]